MAHDVSRPVSRSTPPPLRTSDGPSTPPPRAVLFDLFETLVAPVPRSARKALLAEHELGPSELGYGLLQRGIAEGPALEAMGLSLEQANQVRLTNEFADRAALLAALQQRFCPERQLEEAHIHSVNSWGERLSTLLRCDDDAESLLENLQQADIKLGLISNIDTPGKRVVPRLGLDRWFSAQRFSCAVGIKKPAAAMFYDTLAALGVEASQAVMVGDSWVSDVVGALAVGMRAIWIDRGGDPIARLIYEGDASSVGLGQPQIWNDATRRRIAPWVPHLLPHGDAGTDGARSDDLHSSPTSPTEPHTSRPSGEPLSAANLARDAAWRQRVVRVSALSEVGVMLGL